MKWKSFEPRCATKQTDFNDDLGFGCKVSRANCRATIKNSFGVSRLVLDGATEFLYKATDYSSSWHERCIACNAIRDGDCLAETGAELLASAKDQQGCSCAM